MKLNLKEAFITIYATFWWQNGAFYETIYG